MPFPVLSQQQNVVCDVAGNTSADQTAAQDQTPFVHQFASGARWSLCWHVDAQAGLTLTNVSYGAPGEPSRMVLRQASVAQILLQYDEDTSPTPLLSEIGLGGSRILRSGPALCTDGQSLGSSLALSSICIKERDINLMTQVRNELPTRRHQVSLHSWSRIDNFIYQTIWRLSEDGEVAPAIELTGQLSRFTSDPRFGSPIGDASRLAANATWLSTWRLQFAIDGDNAPDAVDEVQFPFNITDVVRRPIDTRQVPTEAFRHVDREQFRGWIVRDTAATATSLLDESGSPINNLSYFLDPQPSGFDYLSGTNDWSVFDLAITRANECEQLASGNTLRGSTSTNDGLNGCATSLDGYVDGESLADEDIVFWYSIARHLTPGSEDIPALSVRRAAFRLQPFDWSPYTRFDTVREQQ